MKEEELTALPDIIARIAEANPFGARNTAVCADRFRRLIRAFAFGMKPDLLWNGSEPVPVFPVPLLEQDVFIDRLPESASLLPL